MLGEEKQMASKSSSIILLALEILRAVLPIALAFSIHMQIVLPLAAMVMLMHYGLTPTDIIAFPAAAVAR